LIDRHRSEGRQRQGVRFRRKRSWSENHREHHSKNGSKRFLEMGMQHTAIPSSRGWQISPARRYRPAVTAFCHRCGALCGAIGLPSQEGFDLRKYDQVSETLAPG
jgi:hypothetical protein